MTDVFALAGAQALAIVTGKGSPTDQLALQGAIEGAGGDRLARRPANGFDALKAKMAAGLNASAMFLGDSIIDPFAVVGVDTVTPMLFSGYIASQYPNYRVTLQQRQPNDTYGAKMVIQAGPTNAPVLEILSYGAGGSQMQLAMGRLRYASRLLTFSPDVLIVCHGNNFVNNTPIYGLANIKGDLIGPIEVFRQWHPEAGVVWMVEPGRQDDSVSLANVRTAIQQIAAIRGDVVVDCFTAFEEAGKPASWYADNVHPSNLGHAMGMEPSLEAAFNAAVPRILPPTVSSLSALIPPYVQLLDNGDFSQWTTSPGAPNGWTGQNGVVASKDTTIYEDGRLGYSCKLLGASANGNIFQSLPAEKRMSLLGRNVTLFVSRYVPDNSTGDVGRASISIGSTSQGNKTVRTRTLTGAALVSTAAFTPYAIASVPIPDDCTFITVSVAHDPAATPSANAAYFSQAVLVAGDLPRAVR